MRKLTLLIVFTIRTPNSWLSRRNTDDAR